MAMQEREGRKRDSQRCGKSGGGPNAFIPAPELRTGRLASSDAMPDAAGGEGVHEVAKPDVRWLIGRNVSLAYLVISAFYYFRKSQFPIYLIHIHRQAGS